MDAAGVCTANKQALQIYFSKSKPHRVFVFPFFLADSRFKCRRKPRVFYENTIFIAGNMLMNAWQIVIFAVFCNK